jgi:hypothetical protein
MLEVIADDYATQLQVQLGMIQYINRCTRQSINSRRLYQSTYRTIVCAY